MIDNNQQMNQFINYLNTIYETCNQHLLEQGRKRDQVITFYIILMSFSITNFKILDRKLLGYSAQSLIYIILISIGCIILLILADLRSWHTQYLDAIYVINWAMVNNDKCNSVIELQTKMKKILTEPINVTESPKWFNFFNWLKYWLFNSTDNIIYTGMIFLVSLPFWGICQQVANSFGKRLNGSLNILIISFFFIAFLICMLYFFERRLYNVIYNGERYNTWILSFDYNGKLGSNNEMGK